VEEKIEKTEQNRGKTGRAVRIEDKREIKRKKQIKREEKVHEK
jgi:hypothetical protein